MNGATMPWSNATAAAVPPSLPPAIMKKKVDQLEGYRRSVSSWEMEDKEATND